jgi:hypothetical protein
VEGGVETLARQFRKAVREDAIYAGVCRRKGASRIVLIFSVLKARNKVSAIRNSDQYKTCYSERKKKTSR